MGRTGAMLCGNNRKKRCILMNIALYFVFNFVFLVTQYCLNFYSAFFHSSILASMMILCEVMVYYMIRYFSPHFSTSSKITLFSHMASS